MGQYDILDFLEKKWKKGDRKYYSVKELSKILERKCSVPCTKLRYHSVVDWKEMKTSNPTYYYYVYRWKE